MPLTRLPVRAAESGERRNYWIGVNYLIKSPLRRLQQEERLFT